MSRTLKMLAVLAHPDDESLGFGGALAKYSAEGVETYLVTATRGERGRFGSLGKGCDPMEVGRVREAELQAAAAVLGIREVTLLNYPDGGVDQVEAATAIHDFVSQIRRIQADVIGVYVVGMIPVRLAHGLICDAANVGGTGANYLVFTVRFVPHRDYSHAVAGSHLAGPQLGLGLMRETVAHAQGELAQRKQRR